MFDFLRADVAGYKNVLQGLNRFIRDEGVAAFGPGEMNRFAFYYYGVRLGTAMGLSEARSKLMLKRAHTVNFLVASACLHMPASRAVVLVSDCIDGGELAPGIPVWGPVPTEMVGLPITTLSVLCGLMVAEERSPRIIDFHRLRKIQRERMPGLPPEMIGF